MEITVLDLFSNSSLSSGRSYVQSKSLFAVYNNHGYAIPACSFFLGLLSFPELTL